MTGLVYFIGALSGVGLVKVGFSRDPLNREPGNFRRRSKAVDGACRASLGCAFGKRVRS